MTISKTAAALVASGLAMIPSAPGLTININPGPSLAGNAPALAAFHRGANHWANRFADNITVSIDADFAALPAGTIGGASSFEVVGDSYAEIRDALVADAVNRVAAGEAGDTITTLLPTFPQLSVRLPAGRTLENSLLVTKANLKAIAADDGGVLGETPVGIDVRFGDSDAMITFSSTFAFDYDRSDGVMPFAMDFESVVSHEIGHALGFTSTLDEIVATTAAQLPTVTLTALDLFRFRNPDDVPGSPSEFTTMTRSLIPGEDEVFSDAANVWRMSTGLTGGDGRQGSHWKDDALTGSFIGMMDPTLTFGVIQDPTEADFVALGRIGWNLIPIPEPTMAGLSAMVLGLTLRRRQRAA
jgi:hypothetical protein